MTADKQHYLFQLEIRPEKRHTPEFRLLVEALLDAAKEELEWERQAKAKQMDRQRRHGGRAS